MKRLLSTLAALFCCGLMMAQAPTATITVTDTTPTTITARIELGEGCDSMIFMLSESDMMDGYVAMTGLTLEDLVASWGIHTTHDTTYTWREQAPALPYTVYVMAYAGGTSALVTRLTHTATQGGTGESVVSVEVRDVTETSARVICTPNDQTFLFKDQLITVAYFDSVGRDSAMAIVMGGFYPQYETDDWPWCGLTPGTAYYALAIGQNANEEWGPMTMEPFMTLGGNQGIVRLNEGAFNVYPNPAGETVTVDGLRSGALVQIYALDGRLMQQVRATGDRCRMAVEGMPRGTYLMVVAQEGRTAAQRLVLR